MIGPGRVEPPSTEAERRAGYLTPAERFDKLEGCIDDLTRAIARLSYLVIGVVVASVLTNPAFEKLVTDIGRVI